MRRLGETSPCVSLWYLDAVDSHGMMRCDYFRSLEGASEAAAIIQGHGGRVNYVAEYGLCWKIPPTRLPYPAWHLERQEKPTRPKGPIPPLPEPTRDLRRI